MVAIPQPELQQILDIGQKIRQCDGDVSDALLDKLREQQRRLADAPHDITLFLDARLAQCMFYREKFIEAVVVADLTICKANSMATNPIIHMAVFSCFVVKALGALKRNDAEEALMHAHRAMTLHPRAQSLVDLVENTILPGLHQGDATENTSISTESCCSNAKRKAHCVYGNTDYGCESRATRQCI